MTERSKEETELDQAMRSLGEPTPSAALRRAIAEIPLRHPRAERARPAWLPLRAVWALAAAGVLAVALGAASGTWLGEIDVAFGIDATEPSDEAEQAYDEELLEASELAFAQTLEEELKP